MPHRITDPRARAEAQLRLSEERFRHIFENAAVGMAEVGLDGRFATVNDTLCAITGYSREELLQRTFQDITHPDDIDADVALATRLASGELQQYTIEKRYIRRDGSIVFVNLSGSALRDPFGEPLGFVAVIEDISERKAAEEALREAQHEAMQQKDAFIAVLAHELRNPLAPIRTAVALLNRTGPPEPVLERALTVIDRQVIHMTRLVDDLLDVSRLSRGELRLQRGPTRLAAVIESALEQTQPIVAQQRQRVRLEGVHEPIEINADAVRLTQVVGNLLNNAAKYSPPDTDIDLAVTREDDHVEIRVRDRGVGIPAEQLHRVFDLFAQTDSARALSRGGLGIGLALARQLVALHGGTLTASSAGPGLGSEFVVRLPGLLPPGLAPQPQPVAAASRAPIGRRVLVADDNVDAAEMLHVLFTDVGCDVRQVHDGESAVLEAERFQPEVAILDIGMPGINGYDACRRIRQTEWGSSMLIIALTGWGQDADRRRSALAGFDRHFVKPVDPVVLATFVRESLTAPPRS